MEGDRLLMTPEEVLARVDENTIGVVPTLGVTFTGQYEPVAGVAAALDALQADRGLDVPIHVDGASGGFLAPFVDPDLVWDFRLSRVKSIERLGAQVRPRPAGRRLGAVARQGRPPRGPRLHGELPGREHAHLRAQLLAARRPDRRAVLQRTCSP